MRLILDRQHGDKGRGWTPGATVDLDGDGTVDLIEAELTPIYLAAIRTAAEEAGHEVVYLDSGSYRSRHRIAVQRSLLKAQTAYLAAHLNAGAGGDYGAVFFDYRSTGSKLLAECISDSLREACPELSKVRAIEARPDHWTSNAWHTIRGIWHAPAWASGVCLEPCFLDNPDHNQLLTTEGLTRVGLACLRGAEKWAILRS